jgi:all-trans-retinol dehydrogenase (NAD+)
MRVAGTRVLVTGAANGLGFAIATAFARAKSHVVLTDMNAERLAEAVAKLKADGFAACGYQLDVTSPEQIADVRTRVLAEQGPVGVLVNNAGVVFGGPFLGVPLAKHLATVNVNLSGLLAVTHVFLPDLLARPAAHVVNIASASAVIALPMGASYAATKWAVLGFSESLREELRELGHRHVGVTAICPSYIATGLFDGAKPARFTQWLTPEAVADEVVRAVEKGREFVMLPWPARWMYRLCRGWPRSWYRAVCRAVGVSRSMSDWRGHAPPQSEK